MTSLQKYLFIDRDGTIICEPDNFQVDSLEKVKWVPDVITSLLLLQEAGFKLVLVTNQDGLGSAKFPQKDFELPQQFIIQTLQSQGVEFIDVLICPHEEQDLCECRKPKLGLVMGYITSQVIDRENSYVIGDRKTDLQLAKNMGIKGFLIDSKTMNWKQIVKSILEKQRTACLTRITNETKINACVNLNDCSQVKINTGIAFFDHMLCQLATHGGFGLTLDVKGDLDVDDHHTVEDTAIVLGQVIDKALGNKKGLGRYGFVLPLDEALSSVVLDLSGRGFFAFEGKFTRDKVGELSTECVPHFFATFAQNLKSALHIKVTGENNHHMIESIFKAVGRSLRMALQQAGNTIPSTKGSL